MKLDVKKVLITTTIPSNYTQSIREAVCKNGAGIIGDYVFCTYSSQGVGTFKPNKHAHPFIGKCDKIEFVNEDRIEFVCDVEKVKDVLISLRQSHPYEEPAIDIIPLLNEEDFDL